MGKGGKKSHETYSIAAATALATPPPDVAPAPADVVYASGAFDAAVWQPVEQAPDWDKSSGSAEDWHDAGIGPVGATHFLEAGVTDPAVAKEYIDNGISPGGATQWITGGGTGVFISGASAKELAGLGYSPAEAAELITSQLDPVTALTEEADAANEESESSISSFVSTLQASATALKSKPAAPPPPPVLEEEPEEPEPEDEEEPPAADEPDSAGEGSAADEPATDGDESDETTIANEASAIVEMLAQANKVSAEAWANAVTPLPDAIPVGDPFGIPLLVGGDDLLASSATVIAYEGTTAKKAVHEVLVCTVNERAEEKILEALATVAPMYKEVKVPVEKTGQLPVDVQEGIFQKLKTAAVSVNHHLKAGDGMPPHTAESVKWLNDRLAELAASSDPAVQQMVAHYAPFAQALAERVDPSFSLPYEKGGRAPQVSEFETTFVTEETQQVEIVQPVASDKLQAVQREASRISSHIIDGSSQWNGKSRTKAGGIEYAIDLPNGFKAVYHPYAGNNPAHDHYSLRGRLEIQCPGGDQGHVKELVDSLGALNLVNRPMTQSEAEWTYLDRNIEAMGLTNHPTITNAILSSDDLEGQVAQKLMAAHADEALPLLENPPALTALAQRLTLEAQASVLPKRVRIVRNALATVLGFDSGDSSPGEQLAAHPAYGPMPHKAGGWMVFDRFDVMANQQALLDAFGNSFLYRTSGGKHPSPILRMFENGAVFASTERRALAGTTKGAGMSESDDMRSGGAKSAFLRKHVGASLHGHPRIEWRGPELLNVLRSTETYGYNADHFGSINNASSHSTSGMTKDPFEYAKFTQSNNEIMIGDGLDILGLHAPSAIYCRSSSEREQVLALLKEKGVSKIGTRPVSEVIRYDG